MSVHNLVSLAGVFILLGLAWCLSSDRRCVNWRLLAWGLGIQFSVALFLFHAPVGVAVFRALNDVVVEVLGTATAGMEFLFGRLALPPGTVNAQGEESLGFILAFQALPTIVFFSALMSVLYYLRVMPVLIRGFAWVFTRLMRISGAEALCASSNIFVGIESAVTIRPHLKDMTDSEMCTVLAAGMATVASSVLALYVMFLKEAFPSIAGHLISASLLSAPAALMVSKLVLPETGSPATLGVAVKPHYERETSLFEAVINGSNSGVQLVIGICGLLLAVLGLVALVDLFIGALGGRLNGLLGLEMQWSLAGLLGYFFYPFAVILGVPLEEALDVSRLIGLRTVATEIPAYQGLAALLKEGALSPRSAVIATYALCGFAHVASLGIFVGGVSSLVPEKRSFVARVGLRALLSATLACLITACVAGALFTEGMGTVLLSSP